MPKFDLNYLTQQLCHALGKDNFTSSIQNSLKIAFDAHEGQYRESRKSGLPKMPYILHPVGVAILTNKYISNVSLHDHHETIIMAALTHDVLEDTKMTASELGELCSPRVAEIVQALTKPNVRQGEPPQDRNNRFLKKIVHGGETAMYIKICDSLHNISRPANSPSSLIKKAIRKAQRQYMTFFDSGLKSETLKSLYTKILRETSQIAAEIEREHEKPEVLTLEGAINQAVDAASQKVLELHDVRDIIQRLTNASFSSEFTRSELVEQFLPDSENMNQKLLRSTRKKLLGGFLEVSNLPKSMRSTALRGFDSLIVLEVDPTNYQEHNRVMVFGFKKNQRPDWVILNTLKILFGYLTERLRVSEGTHYIALSSDAGALGISLLPNEISRAGFNYSDLLDLKKLLQGAHYIHKLLLAEIEKRLDCDNSYILTSNLESRIKQPSSIVRKVTDRRLTSICDVDDIVGFRLICLDLDNQKELISLIDDVCGSISVPLLEGDKSENSPFRSLIESSKGYKAHHLLFSFQADDIISPITVEFQIRTSFQDAWAKTSTELQYKKSNLSKAAKSGMSHLAKLRDEADDLISKISKSSNLPSKAIYSTAIVDRILLRRTGTPRFGQLWFVHGFGDSGLAFADLFQTKITDNFELIVPDLPGFGRSPSPKNTGTINRYANLLKELILKTSSQSPYGIVAHSLGSPIAVDTIAMLDEKPMGLFSIEGNLTEAGNSLTKRTEEFDDAVEFKSNYLCDHLSGVDKSTSQSRYLSNVTLADAESFWQLGRDAMQRSRQKEDLALQFVQTDCEILYYAGLGTCDEDREYLRIHASGRYKFYNYDEHWPMISDPSETASEIQSFFKVLFSRDTME